ncbi:MAG TPA: ABC transporter ATP-binding protein [Nitratifractor sp.]|nr:ABC transporter ATP-binding protein [Nitratifractor sp.]
MVNTSAVSVKNLSKIYNIYNEPSDRLKEVLNPFRKSYHSKFYAIDNLSLDIKRGETVGLIGKNGAGKSTLLKIITGVLTPTFGEVKVNGKIASLLELGAGFNPEMSGIENIYLNGTIMGYTKMQMDKRIDAIITFADIGNFIYQPVKMYSSGMFARLAFSVAINVDPDILIIDEALSVGDMAFQNKCFERMNDFIKSDKSILFVSHSLSAIRLLCDKVAWIESGKLIEYGDTKSVTRNYERATYSSSNQCGIKREAKRVPQLESGLIKDRVKSLGEKTSSEECYFSDIALRNSKEGHSNFTTFSDITLEMLICSYLPHETDIGLGVAITRQDGLEVSRVNNIRDDKPITLKPGYTKVSLSFPKLSLLDGEYFLSFFLSHANLLQSFHKIENLIQVSITTPYAQCGWKVSEGVTALTHNWDINT